LYRVLEACVKVHLLVVLTCVTDTAFAREKNVHCAGAMKCHEPIHDRISGAE
jgi:hypothetical protein